jgi:hypothetical protein
MTLKNKINLDRTIWFLLSAWWANWLCLNVGYVCVCLAKYEHRVGKADYRVCKGVEVKTYAMGLVRSVMVELKPRNVRENLLPYKSMKLKNLKLMMMIKKPLRKWEGREVMLSKMSQKLLV